MSDIKIAAQLLPLMRPVISIKPYWRNPRKNAPAVAATQASIEQYGWNVPITVDVKNVVITGHTRLIVARNLGMTDVPVVTLNHLSPAQIKEYRIADNRTSELSEWDNVALLNELKELDNMPAFTNTFFVDIDIDKMMMDPLRGTQSDVTPENLDKKNQKVLVSFRAKVKDEQDSQLPIDCPHCGQKMYISIDELKSKIRVKKELGSPSLTKNDPDTD